MLWPKGECLVYSSTNLFNLLIVFHNFSTSINTQLGLPHLSIVGILWCVCAHPNNLMNIHFLCYVHGNERTKSHDVVHNTFATIAQNANFHVGQEKLHSFFSTTFNSFDWRIDIVFTKDGICTLVDVVITNSTWINLLSQSCANEAHKWSHEFTSSTNHRSTLNHKLYQFFLKKNENSLPKKHSLHWKVREVRDIDAHCKGLQLRLQFEYCITFSCWHLGAE
jgi:hypothetical protein